MFHMKQSIRFQARAAAAVKNGNVKRANKLAKRATIAASRWDGRR
jgi:hypothetical protein